MPNQTLYGSNADRLKKAMLQRTKPAGSPHTGSPHFAFVQPYDDIPVDPLHASISTFASLSSSSSESTDSRSSYGTPSITTSTAPSSSMQSQTHIPLDSPSHLPPSHYSSQNTLQRKQSDYDSNLSQFTSIHSPLMSPTVFSMSSQIAPLSPSNYGISTLAQQSPSDHSRVIRTVPSSINSYSSFESQEKRTWASRRLFEKPPHAATLSGPLMVLQTPSRKTMDSEPAVQVVDYNEKNQLTEHTNLSLDEYFTASSRTSAGARGVYPSSSNLTNTRSLRGMFSTPNLQADVPNATHFDLINEFTDHSLRRPQLRAPVSFETRLGMPSIEDNLTQNTTFSAESLDVDFNAPRRSRANSLCSIESVDNHTGVSSLTNTKEDFNNTGNSFMQALPTLDLDLDHVIRNALVESSALRAPSRMEFGDHLTHPHIPSSSSNMAMMSTNVLPLYSSSQVPMDEMSRPKDEYQISYSEPMESSKKSKSSRFGSTVRRFARKIAN